MTPANAERTARASAWLSELHGRARKWVTDQTPPRSTARTESYIDLLFAFGQARLGHSASALTLLFGANEALAVGDDPAHRALLEAFRFRNDQALRGEPHRGPLPSTWYEGLEGMERTWRYVVDRARSHLVVLEPDRRISVYRHWGASISAFEVQLASLQDVLDIAEFIARVDQLRGSRSNDSRGQEERGRVLHQALRHASLATPEATRVWLSEAIPRILSEPFPEEPGAVLEFLAFAADSVGAAAHHRLRDEFLQAVQVVPRLFDSHVAVSPVFPLEELLSRCVRGFIAFRLTDELAHFLGAITPRLSQAAQGNELAQLCANAALAEGWHLVGRAEAAEPVLRQVLHFLPSLRWREVGRLACAVARGMKTAPGDQARTYFPKLLDGSRATDTHTTSTHYALTQLEIVEAIVLSAVKAFLND